MEKPLTPPSSLRDRLRPLQAVLLVAVCLAAFLPGIFSLPPIDRDEARFVQATHQMVETGNYVDIHFQDETRYKKPIGIYWLQSTAIALTGHGADAPIWSYRLVSVLGATLSVLGVAWLGARLFGSHAGLIAGLVQASILMLCFEGRIAKTDAALLATVVFAQAALASLWIAHREGRPTGWAAPLVFWIATGAGVLIKGPVTPLVSLLTAVALGLFYREWRWLRRLKPWTGLAIVVAMAAPWLILITMKSGGAFWQESVGKDLLGKVGGAQESHGAPPGFYTLIFVFFMWPFGLMGLRSSLHLIGRFRDDPRLAFLLAWYVPYWIVVEAIPTKLPNYILPAYPAVALALAWAVTTGLADQPFGRLWKRWLTWATFAGHIAATLALAAFAVGGPIWLNGRFSAIGLIAALAALLAGGLSSGLVPARSPRYRVYGASAAAILTFGLLTASVLPGLKAMWLSPAITEAYKAHRPCPQSVLVSAGYEEPSLVFLAGTKTVLTDGAGAAARIAADPACAIVAVDRREAKDFFAALPQGQASVKPVASLKGINYSKGRKTTVTLFTAAVPENH